MNVLLQPVGTSLGKKYLMAITGLGLIGFVVVHMAGNLLIFAGREALNSYAHALKSNPALLWGARLGLALVFIVHVWLGIRLSLQNRSARPQRYVYEDTLQASWASRHMLLTGLVLLAFILYHLAHFTLGVVHEASFQTIPGQQDHQFEEPKNYLDLNEWRTSALKGYEPDTFHLHSTMKKNPTHAPNIRHDVYSMVINGFRNPWITGSYLLAMAFLGLHLWHGGSSWFQSLGLNGPRIGKVSAAFGPVLAVVVVAGNCSMPLAVWLGLIR